MAVLNDEDTAFMRLALSQAKLAAHAGEVPVGAVLVKDGEVLAEGRNAVIAAHDPTAHAEILAMRSAGIFLKTYRLEGCTLYCTLEPCAMCAGALLHARLHRVVFGAYDEKIGAAGSFLNLFSDTRLNHRTILCGGVLASECAEVLQLFFQSRRATKRMQAVPLREDALRTPLTRFDELPLRVWQEHYVQDLPSLQGYRMHYVDEGPACSAPVFLCLHDSQTWSDIFSSMFTVWLAAGARLLAPDCIGFGKSDKPKRESVHTLDFHRNYLLDWILKLDLQEVVLVLPRTEEGLGFALQAQLGRRIRGVVVLDTRYVQERARSSAVLRQVLEAPFLNSGYCAGLRAFQSLREEGVLCAKDNTCLADMALNALMLIRYSESTALHVRDPVSLQASKLNDCKVLTFQRTEDGAEYAAWAAQQALDYFAAG
jgi:tRNA(adenine34) deaminase